MIRDILSLLPHDIINGQPLHYCLEANGQFILYSVGWNETDDGGYVVLRKGGVIDREKGGWVWQYPTKRLPEIKFQPCFKKLLNLFSDGGD